MSYSTGSGDYVALMAAVLAHAQADGWSDTGGTWPISKGNVRGVDWKTYTATEFDRTFTNANRTVRYLQIAVGTSKANATANAALTANSAQVANMHYTFTTWHIFSDPSLCDYIHVVANFSNGVNGDCYVHFSFGELNKNGMAHTAIVYATGSTKRGYSISTAADNTCDDWNCAQYGRSLSPFNGTAGFSSSWMNYHGLNALSWIVDPTVNPFPGAGWFSPDTVYNDDQVFNTIMNSSSGWSNIGTNDRVQFADFYWGSYQPFAIPAPYSGALSMGPLPFIALQGLTTSSKCMYLGAFPNVRTCGMESYVPGSVVTYGGEDWMIFPMLRSTPWAQTQVLDLVSSGRAAFAYKKVV